MSKYIGVIPLPLDLLLMIDDIRKSDEKFHQDRTLRIVCENRIRSHFWHPLYGTFKLEERYSNSYEPPSWEELAVYPNKK